MPCVTRSPWPHPDGDRPCRRGRTGSFGFVRIAEPSAPVLGKSLQHPGLTALIAQEHTMRIAPARSRAGLAARLLRGAAALTLLALGASACSSGGAATGSYTQMPAETGHPRSGGTAVVAQTPGLTPSTLFPFAPPSQGSPIAPGVMWRALYHPSADPKQEVDTADSLAAVPSMSADRR